MFRHGLILILSASLVSAVPRASHKTELQQLARLPKVEFAPPLQFDRKTGFVLFPDRSSALAEAGERLAEAKGLPSEAGKYLDCAYLLEANDDFAAALRFYARAADLFRKRIELEPGNADELAGLAEALVSIGRSTEAQTQIEKALALKPGAESVLLSAARVFQERAWQAAAGDQRLFTGGTFLESATDLLKDSPDASRIGEARKYLRLASDALDKASAAKDHSADVEKQRACFLSFRGVLEEVLNQVQGGEANPKTLRDRLFNENAVEVLARCADRAESEPEVLAVAALATVFQQVYASGRPEDILEADAWPHLDPATQRRLRDYCGRLGGWGETNAEKASAAAEVLGCIQLFILRDFEGGQRSFQQAVRQNARRHRAWELLVLATALGRDRAELLEACQSRFSAFPDARGSTLLAKAYYRSGDEARAELVAITALAAHPNDFLLNLSVAALLLKRENAEDYLWRAQELLRRAEKQITPESSGQARLDFALTKSIFLALSDKPEEARTLLRPFTGGPSVPPEVEDVMRVLDR